MINYLERLNRLTTAELADACLQLGITVRCAPSELQAISGNMHCAGRVLPTHHAGSVDIFLEALENAVYGDILVVDDRGRKDRSCVGDMIAREIKLAGVSGIIIWGCHRDTKELLRLELPIFSLGRIPTGPQAWSRRQDDAMEWARVGEWIVTREDIAVADEDGVIFIPYNKAEEIIIHAESIRNTELRQAMIIQNGTGLREQFYFKEYLEKRKKDPSYDFRTHLQSIGGAIE